jgi:2,3-dimethylmalate lyase
LINDPKILVLPACHDGLSAKVLEQAGFEAITVAGYGTAGSMLGRPDIGLVTASEMVTQYRNICNLVDVPVFVDIDTGFGDVNNTIRMVQECEKAGVAGLFIEDQTYPKRCGHMAGKSVVPVEEYLPKLKAALWAREDKDMMIMARTDSVAVYGIDEGIRRAKLYAENGADMVFVEAVHKKEDMIRVNTALKEAGVPSMANMIEGGASPLLTAEELQEIGYAVVAYPCSSCYVAVKALQDWATHLRKNGTTRDYLSNMISFDEYFKFIGAEDIRNREKKFF